jgi:hypothetical protein
VNHQEEKIRPKSVPPEHLQKRRALTLADMNELNLTKLNMLLEAGQQAAVAFQKQLAELQALLDDTISLNLAMGYSRIIMNMKKVNKSVILKLFQVCYYCHRRDYSARSLFEFCVCLVTC